MKYKKLTKEQILISFDRLTRFKNTKEKYFRVFSDIILSNLIEPKYKKSELLELNPLDLKNIVEEIINSSLEEINADYNVNKRIKEYENSIFVNDEYTQILLDNKINYNAVLNILSDDVINLKWLRQIITTDCSNEERFNYALKFPIEKVLLVEGITEEILLPKFSEILGFDFYKHGVQIIPAGGKNQVVKMYYKLIEELKIPIFLLLDNDAEDNIKQISPKLRSIDKIHLVSCGEFEDMLPMSLILKTINIHFKNFVTITKEDFCIEKSIVENLEEIFKTKCLHEFKKAEFAKLIKENIRGNEDISTEIVNIIEEIFLK